MIRNQIFQNVYCNSASYDRIYNKNRIMTRLHQTKGSVENNHILPNMQFFSNMLRINVGSVTAPRNRYNSPNNIEIDRRGLSISMKPIYIGGNDYVLFKAMYEYIFDFHSTAKRYSINENETINNKKCRCINVLQNGIYTFQNENNPIFHFSFHSPSTIPNDDKVRGAFHIKIDTMRNGSIIPYRPFILDPRKSVVPKRFITWDTFDLSMNDFFTTNKAHLGVNDINLFVRRNPHIIVSYPNGPDGRNVHYINDIIKPIYDQIITDMLNPVVRNNPLITSVPAAVEYKHGANQVECEDLIQIGINTSHWTTLTQNNRRIILGGNRRKTAKKRRFPAR